MEIVLQGAQRWCRCMLLSLSSCLVIDLSLGFCREDKFYRRSLVGQELAFLFVYNGTLVDTQNPHGFPATQMCACSLPQCPGAAWWWEPGCYCNRTHGPGWNDGKGMLACWANICMTNFRLSVVTGLLTMQLTMIPSWRRWNGSSKHAIFLFIILIIMSCGCSWIASDDDLSPCLGAFHMLSTSVAHTLWKNSLTSSWLTLKNLL